MRRLGSSASTRTRCARDCGKKPCRHASRDSYEGGLVPMTAPGSVAGITPLAQLAPDAPSAVMDALQQLRAVLAPYEQPVEVPVVAADPRDRMQEAIDAVNATVTNRTQLRAFPTALLALSDKSRDERRALIQTPLYQRAPGEAQREALRDQLVTLAPRVVPLIERAAAGFAAVRTAWPLQRQPGKQLLLPKARPDVWDVMQLILTVPRCGGAANLLPVVHRAPAGRPRGLARGRAATG